MKISAFYPNYFREVSVTYACLSILDGMRACGLDVGLMGIASDVEVQREFYRDAIPRWAKPVAYRLVSVSQLQSIAEWRFNRSLDGSEVVYLWPRTSAKVFQKLKERGHIILAENINTHQETSKAILDEEFARLGLTPSHGINKARIDDENLKLSIADFVYSPGPLVTSSLLASGLAEGKILESSYGIDSDAILPRDITVHEKRTGELTAIFVGLIGIRKGAHLLVEHWIRSGVEGKLKLVGDIDPGSRHLIEPFLSRPDIEHVQFTRDLHSIYREADIFLFPSLEEGSPLVTYLALGAGLPSIVSPMGGQGVIRHGVDGLVCDPHNSDAWVESIRRVFTDTDLRMGLANNARIRAHNYLWPKVARQRVDILQSRLNAAGTG